MVKDFAAGLTALLALGVALPLWAADPHDPAVQVAERVLGSADEAAQARAYLPFSRQIGARGTVAGSLAESTATAGVPAAAMLEALRALGTAIDLESDVRDGDRFYVRYEQGFTLEGQPIGVGRVLWVELKTAAKGTIAVHRFRTRAGIEQFWLASGKAAAPPEIGTPLDTMTLTSGFGLRKDPLDHPPGPLAGLATPPPAPPVAPPPKAEPTPEEKAATVRDEREVARAAAGFGSNGQLDSRRSSSDAEIDRIMVERRIRERRQKEEAEKAEKDAAARAAERAAAKAAAPPVVEQAPPPAPTRLYMHEGLDLLANTGTPVHAAADGMVIGAGPNGGYGNWIRIRHPGGLTTVYGHLSAFAPGLEKGTMVARGELIGLVGNTGRSTGAHLHFEVLVDGRPVDPRTHPATRPAQLAGADLERLRKQVAASLSERDQETAALRMSSIPF